MDANKFQIIAQNKNTNKQHIIVNNTKIRFPCRNITH